MFELDFDRSQPPVIPPRDVWIAKYRQALAEESAVTDPVVEETDASLSRTAAGQFAGEVILIDSADYEEIVNG